jgi:hypothetical protein
VTTTQVLTHQLHVDDPELSPQLLTKASLFEIQATCPTADALVTAMNVGALGDVLVSSSYS